MASMRLGLVAVSAVLLVSARGMAYQPGAPAQMVRRTAHDELGATSANAISSLSTSAPKLDLARMEFDKRAGSLPSSYCGWVDELSCEFNGVALSRLRY